MSKISTILSRAALVKDETNLDKFDQVSSATVFKGLETVSDAVEEAPDPGRMAEKAGREIPDRGREGPDRGPWVDLTS